MKKLSKILFNVFLYLFGILYVATTLMMANASAINSAFGIATTKTITDSSALEMLYYNSDYYEEEEIQEASNKIVQEVMDEGVVLLKNADNALPLSQGAKVNFYSANSVNMVVTGTGSSGSETTKVKEAVSFKTAFTQAGFAVNSDLWDWYNTNTQYWQGNTFGGNKSQTQKFSVKDANWAQITTSAKSNQAEAGIFVISRNSGENADMADSYVQLADVEKDVLTNMKALKDAGTLSKIIVIMNSANEVECDFVDNAAYGIDALLWVGTVGSSGTVSIANIMAGKVNPSGKLSDTFWYKHSQNPVNYNIGDTEYKSSSVLTKFNSGENKKYVAYQEGIYNGYRYTETRYEDLVLGTANVGTYDYNSVVSYPFGYGLSYTSFEYSNFSTVYDNVKDVYTVKVTVKNTGSVAGKEVVEVYVQKPYTDYDKQNGIEKASVELAGYDKTKLLEPNETEELTITVKGQQLASYDSNNAKTYIIDGGDYYFTVASDSHTAINNIIESKYDQNSESVRNKSAMVGSGNKNLVFKTTLTFDKVKYSTNSIITEANESFTADYAGQVANFGVSSITNQFDDVDFTKYQGFSASEREQKYLTRSDWSSTFGQKITLTATTQLKNDQASKTPSTDNVAYPTYGSTETNYTLIDLRTDDQGNLLDYDDPLWDKLLDQVTWDETVAVLTDGLRATQAVPSISAPLTAQQNGAVGPVQSYGYNPTTNPWQGFDKLYGEYNASDLEYPVIFPCNGIVASTYNDELIEKLGEQVGEECLWCGYAGIYGLGVNIHRGSTCGRSFEYYSEDSYLAGMACAMAAKGIQSKGVFVILKHAVLNDQETNRHNVCSWANEQTIREVYLVPTQMAVEYGDEAGMMGMMTGLNRLGATWTSAQGFCNTVLRAEFGMKGYIISDYYKGYMSPAAGIMGGDDLPDGSVTEASTTNDGVVRGLQQYSSGYGEFAWKMRESLHRVLYTVVRSAQMNLTSSSMKFVKITPAWETAMNVATIATGVLLALSFLFLIFANEILPIIERKRA